VLHQSSGNFGDTLLRRLELAYNALFNGRRMPYVVAAGVIAVGFAYRNRRWLYRPLNQPVWQAALVGGLVSCIAGSFANDSGPLLFVVGMFGLVVATGYIQGDPRLSATDQPSGGPPARAAPPTDEADVRASKVAEPTEPPAPAVPTPSVP